MSFEKNFLGNDGMRWFMGIVEDRDDDLEAGRYRVRCFGIHSADRALIPTEALPWAQVGTPTTSPSISGVGENPFLLEGTMVYGFFMDGEEAQHPLIIGSIPGVPLQKVVKSSGFGDPNGKYPLYLDEPDVNKLARGDQTAAQVANKKKNVTKGIPTVTGTFDQPDVPYAAKYPQNHVKTTESGHALEMDDTPGAERISLFHRIGTYFEMFQDGQFVESIQKTVTRLCFGDSNEYVQGKKNLTVGAGAEIHVNAIGGDGLKISVSNTGNLEITVASGDLTFRVLNGNLNTYVNGDVNEAVTGNYNRQVLGEIKDTSATSITQLAPTITLN